MTEDYTIKLINDCTAFASTVITIGVKCCPATPCCLRWWNAGMPHRCFYPYGDDECWLDCLPDGLCRKQHDNVAIVHPLQAPPANNGKKDCHSSLFVAHPFLWLIPFCGSSLFVVHPFCGSSLLWFIPFCGSSFFVVHPFLWFIPFVVHPFLWLIPLCGSSLFVVHPFCGSSLLQWFYARLGERAQNMIEIVS